MSEIESVLSGERRWCVVEGDCLDVLRSMPDASVDAIVTDPPYGLSFMGRKWDYDVPGEDVWRECLRVLKPGGHLLAFAGTRTQHRMAVRIEDAGFEIRDMVAWMYGSGFPKSLDVSKAIDRAAGAEREVVGKSQRHGGGTLSGLGWNIPAEVPNVTAPATEAARRWAGWGTALKPAFEPVTVARKPLQGTVAANVLAHGTGALNVDGCRVCTTDDLNGGRYSPHGPGEADAPTYGFGFNMRKPGGYVQTSGRWPANVVLDPEAAAVLDEQSGESTTPAHAARNGRGRHAVYNNPFGRQSDVPSYGDSGGASRFFYVAKADRAEREEGLRHRVRRPARGVMNTKNWAGERFDGAPTATRANTHPTVKPIALMRWLVRLITPPGGVVLDPFTGSGTTGIACSREGARFVGIEREAEYVEIARERIAADAPLLDASEPDEMREEPPEATQCELFGEAS